MTELFEPDWWDTANREWWLTRDAWTRARDTWDANTGTANDGQRWVVLQNNQNWFRNTGDDHHYAGLSDVHSVLSDGSGSTASEYRHSLEVHARRMATAETVLNAVRFADEVDLDPSPALAQPFVGRCRKLGDAVEPGPSGSAAAASSTTTRTTAPALVAMPEYIVYWHWDGRVNTHAGTEADAYGKYHALGDERAKCIIHQGSVECFRGCRNYLGMCLGQGIRDATLTIPSSTTSVLWHQGGPQVRSYEDPMQAGTAYDELGSDSAKILIANGQIQAEHGDFEWRNSALGMVYLG